MAKARITSKGQVTIPADVRRALGAEPGDDLVFEVREDRVAFTVVKRSALTELRGVLPVGRPYEGRDAEREAAGRAIGEKRELHPRAGRGEGEEEEPGG